MVARGDRSDSFEEEYTPLWLSHHWPDQYDRCLVVGGRHVCRRYALLYPVALAVMALSIAGYSWPEALDPWLVVLLPIPAVVELCLEQLGVLGYQPRRQLAVTLPLAVGLGRGFGLYLDDQTDLLFWGPVVVYSAICGGCVLVRARREARPVLDGASDGEADPGEIGRPIGGSDPPGGSGS